MLEMKCRTPPGSPHPDQHTAAGLLFTVYTLSCMDHDTRRLSAQVKGPRSRRVLLRSWKCILIHWRWSWGHFHPSSGV